MKIVKRIVAIVIMALLTWSAFAQQQPWKGKFEQLDQMLPTPNSYRSGSGAPGPAYWQQRADYVLTTVTTKENRWARENGNKFTAVYKDELYELFELR